MSSEKLENPVSATRFIPNFTNFKEVDEILFANLQFEREDGLLICLLPIVDQVAENKRGIVRIFLSNSGDLPLELDVSYNTTGWFSDLGKRENAKFLEKVKISPKQVLVRDIDFKSSVKQGKNYFQIILTKNKGKSQEDIFTHHIEYSQIREIKEVKQIERSNFLGMSSKAYINPFHLNYWIYYSLFGPNKYRRDNVIITILKVLIMFGGIALGVLSLFLDVFSGMDFILPIGVIVAIIAFISFFSFVDRHRTKLIIKLDLTTAKHKGSLDLLKPTSSERLTRFCLNDINFHYDTQKDNLCWKEGANKLFQKIIPEVSKRLKIDNPIKAYKRTRKVKTKEIKDKEELKEKIERGIQLQHEEGIDFENTIQSVAQDAKGVPTTNDGISTDSSVTPKVEKIETDSDVELKIDPIKTKEKVQPHIDPIETGTKVEPKLDPIETKTKGMDTSGKKIDIEKIPSPQKIPKDEENSFKSVKEKEEE